MTDSEAALKLGEVKSEPPVDVGITPADQEAQKEISLEERVLDLSIERNAIKREREIRFILSNLLHEGLQTLIQTFGSENVFAAIKAQYEAKKDSDFSMLDVIRQLEPDKEKRKKLFENIVADARAQGKELENEFLFSSRHGGAGNYARLSEQSVFAMRGVDVVKNLGIPLSLSSLVSHDALNLALYIFQDESQATKLKEGLSKSGNDVYRLTEEMHRGSKQRTNELHARIDTFRDELQGKIDTITQTLQDQFNIWKATLVADIGKFGDVEALSEEANGVLLQALATMKEKIDLQEKTMEQKVQAQTKPLTDVMAHLDMMKSCYY